MMRRILFLLPVLGLCVCLGCESNSSSSGSTGSSSSSTSGSTSSSQQGGQITVSTLTINEDGLLTTTTSTSGR